MSASPAYPVRSPDWVLTYAGVNITADISRMVLSITYVDHLAGAAGEVEIELEDHDKRWQGPWYPLQGDLVNLSIGYHGAPLLPCGDFQVDELEVAGPPDVFHLRCLAAYITPAMRTPNSLAYEGQTLLQIAAAIAGKYGLHIVSVPDTLNLSFARMTQKRETDLAFLHRIAREHGYDFTVRGQTLVFYARAKLETAAPVSTISRSDVLSFALNNKTHRIYKSAEVAYQDPATKQLIAQTVAGTPAPPTGDTIKLAVRCENGQQALLRAQAALHEANMIRKTAQLVLPGSTLLAAGNNITLSGFGVSDGTYLIQVARHRLNRQKGYVTEVEARQLA